MSSYKGKIYHPENPKLIVEAMFIDDYFGQHKYGVQIDGEDKVYRREDIETTPE